MKMINYKNISNDDKRFKLLVWAGTSEHCLCPAIFPCNDNILMSSVTKDCDRICEPKSIEDRLWRYSNKGTVTKGEYGGYAFCAVNNLVSKIK